MKISVQQLSSRADNDFQLLGGCLDVALSALEYGFECAATLMWRNKQENMNVSLDLESLPLTALL